MDSLSLCEMRWKKNFKTSTNDGHIVYFCGEEDKQKYWDGFRVQVSTRALVLFKDADQSLAHGSHFA